MNTIFILGGADCVFDDLISALDITSPDYIIGINDVVAYYPGHIDMMVTLHPRNLTGKHWISARKDRGYPDIPVIASQAKVGPFVTHVYENEWPEMFNSGSSGLFATKIAVDDLNSRRVILCGVPICVGNKHFFDNAKWSDANIFQPQWKAVENRLIGKVKSMSGFTAELLGTPTREWVNGFDN